jgi:N-acetylneuraminic acid mutarotase
MHEVDNSSVTLHQQGGEQMLFQKIQTRFIFPAIRAVVRGRQRVVIGLVSVLATLLIAGQAPAQQAGPWSKLKPIPQGEEEVYGTAAGGKLYVLGGLGAFPGWEPKQMLWTYDPASDQWTKLPSIPEGIHHPGFAAVGNKLYSIGGFLIARPAVGLPAWVPTNSVWIFDVTTNTWSKGPPLPTARGALTATAVGTKIYAIGGAKNPSYSTPELRPTVPVENVATNEVYDTTTNTWSSVRPMLTARNHHGAALIDGKIYVVGGRVGSTFIIGLSTNVSTHEVYDVAKNTWSSVLGVPTARSGVGTAVLNGRLHVLGGEAYLNDLVGTYRTHEAYDPRTNNWERLPPMPTPRHGLAVAEIGGKIYAVSGSNVAGGGGPHEGVNVNEVYDPK